MKMKDTVDTITTETKYIACVSFGKDSLAMLLLLLEKDYPLDEVIFFDTEVEFDSVYKVKEQVRPLLEEKGITFTELSYPNGSWMYWMVEKPIKYRFKEGYHCGKGWCGWYCRWGTQRKQYTMRDYLKDNIGQDYIQYLGITADEVKRIEKNTNEKTVLPLVEWGITEAQCLEYCHSKGFYWLEDNGLEIYDYLKNTSCWLCANRNLDDLRTMYHFFNNYWEQLKQIQTMLGEDKYFHSGYQTVFDLEKRFKFEDEWIASGKGSIRSRQFYKELKEYLGRNSYGY